MGETIYSAMLLSHSPMPPPPPVAAAAAGDSTAHSSVLLSSKTGSVIPCHKPLSSGSTASVSGKEDVKWQVWSDNSFVDANPIAGVRVFRDDG